MTPKQFMYRVHMKIKHEKLRMQVKRMEWQTATASSKRNPEIIISLTSYPKRFPDLELCLKSLANQKMKADRIILWLGNDASEKDAEDLEKKYKPFDIEIRRDAENNYYSHKKYYYAIENYSHCIIVLADDDMIYPPDWLESLYKSYVKHPDCISARRVHRITWDESGNPMPYIRWKGEDRARVPAHDLVAITGAGTLIPPNCLCGEILNHAIFMKKARTADDLWIKIMAILSRVKVVWAENNMIMPTTVNLNQHEELENINVTNGKNDTVFHELMDYYQLEKKDFQ